MATMKTKNLFWMMAGVWMLAACSHQDELLQQDNEVNRQRVTVSAYVPDEAGSRLAFEDQGANGLKVSWKESGESFSVMTADEAEVVTFTQTEGSEFAGPNGFIFQDEKEYYAFYPELDAEQWGEYNDQTEGYDLKVSATAIPFDFSMQTGQLDESVNLMYAKRSAEGDFQFQHMLAVMKFTLRGIKGNLINTIDFNFNKEGVSHYTSGTVNVTGETPVFSYEWPGYISISIEDITTDSDGNPVFYAYLPPLEAGTTIQILAYSANEQSYMEWFDELTVKAEGIQPGKYYTAARKMEEKKDSSFSLNQTVSDTEELLTWMNNLSYYNKVNMTLTADIDLSRVSEENYSSINSLSGTVDGGGHTIKGLKVNIDYAGAAMFNTIEAGGIVKNLHLRDVEFRGAYTGGIVIENFGTISGCSVSGSITGLEEDYLNGGIVSSNYGTITGCYNIATVSGKNYSIGGIAGVNEGSITACYNTGKLTLTNGEGNFIGGIAGQNEGNITQCYWNCTGPTYGVGYNSGNDDVTQVNGSSVTWNSARNAMNAALSGSGWQYVANTDDDTKTQEPLKLQKVTTE